MVGQDITELATQGPELVFVAYPQALSEMMPPALWSTMFFLCLFVLGQVSKKLSFHSQILPDWKILEA